LLIGDIVGKPGRHIVVRALPGLRIEHGLDFVIANAENIAGGSGLTPVIYHELMTNGVDCITMGDHVYRRREVFQVFETETRIVKPANYPDNAPGRNVAVLRAKNGVRVAVFNLLGRVFMPPIDCPLRAADRVLNELPNDVKVIVLDYHAEATSDKQVMGRYLDGRVSAVLGTHTHVTTADEQILPGGTAFQCDVGMSGPHESIIGRKIECVLETTKNFKPIHFEVASNDCQIHGTIVDIAPETGRAAAIQRLVVNQTDADRLAVLTQKTSPRQESIRRNR
jgi:metallophosphoesterase (TIGR00282 family)